MKILNIFRMLFLSIGLFVSFSFSILLGMKFFLSSNDFRDVTETSFVLFKNCIKNDSSVNGLTNLEKIKLHFKFLFKQYVMGNFDEITEDLSKFKVSTLNYANLRLLFTEIFVRNIYNFSTDNLSPLIVDGGSNVGMSMIFFKSIYPNSKIIGFEPSKKCFKLLEENIKNNHFENEITVFNKALSNEENTAKLYRPGSVCGSIKSEFLSDEFEDIETVRLSSYINQDVDLLKLDIEGAEYDVIKDLAENDKLRFIKNIIMEYHYPENGLASMLNFFDKNGFAYKIENDLIYASRK